MPVHSVRVHSTKDMARRAVDLCVELLHATPTPGSVARVLRSHGEPSPVLTSSDVEDLRSAAVRLEEVFGASSVSGAASLLNRMLAHPPRLTSHEGTAWHLHADSSDEAPWGEWFLSSSALALSVLLAEHQRVPGGLCASAGCRKPYLDLGGGSPQRYCTPRCATRERVAAHRARTPT
ncbi:CGNR zinc finger domain-containing protein [Nonomuraea sediminis]|uniref:CGNR zinc finger domain-containing protein n=1 Tax=Nonomuraea sediminis TaxID=2835864 RepID=UPI0027DFF3EE|nr:CGNR zinc finger domain-containing protein [Nonomuraea sediminis]